MSTFTRPLEYVTVGPCSAVVNDRTGAKCGQRFAMNRDFYDQTKRTGETWYCPSGHPRIWTGQTTEARLKSAEAQLTATQDQLRAAVRDAEDVRRALVRDRHRFANGVCPCCNRSFENVARHIRGQHPDYDVTNLNTDRGIRFRCSCGQSFETPRGLAIHQGHNRNEGWDSPDASQWRAHLTKVDA